MKTQGDAETTCKIEKRWESIDLTLTEVESGLIIAQHGESYFARHWTLSETVVSVMDRAVASGLGCVIQFATPQRNRRLPVSDRGVEYIGFAQRPEECWVFVLDQYSVRRKTAPRREPFQVTFAKHYRGLLDTAGVPFTNERTGGKNVFVPIHALDAALAACGAQERESIEAVRSSRDWKRARADMLGITSEDMLEAWMMAEWKSLPFGRRMTLVRNQMPANGYLDILAEDRHTQAEVIFELKLNMADGRVIREQLARYVEYRRRYAPQVWGAVVAREFSSDAIKAVGDVDFPIELFRFHDAFGRFRLERVCGTWPPGKART